MNEKIKELSTKARLIVNEVYRSLKEEPEGDFDVWYHDMVEEKFAELIVKECINIADKRGAYEVMDDIIDHFGVE